MKKSTLIAGAMALSFGMLQGATLAMAHGHGGGGHHGGGGGHHSGGGGHHDNGHHNDNNHHDHYNNNDHYNGGNFWAGAAVGGVVVYGAGNLSTDTCQDPDYRSRYPGRCD